METLNNLMPILVIGSLTLFMTLEYWRPYFKHGAGRGRQRARNIVIIAAGVLVSVAVGGVFSGTGGSKCGSTVEDAVREVVKPV